MHVFIAGASGAIGTRLALQLVKRGHTVTTTTTNPATTSRLEALGTRPVVMDGLNAQAVGEAVATATPDAVVHQMTALAGTPDLRNFDRWFAMTNRLRIEGTDHLLAAAEAAGVPHVVTQSFTGWPNERRGSWIKTEDDPLDPTPPGAQRGSLRAIRHVEESVLAAPLIGTVLRYGGFYGAGASDGLVEMVRKRRFPLVADGAGMASWIHLDDAASATVTVLEMSRAGLFNIVDDEPAPVSEWLPYLASVIGAKPPLRLPGWLGRLAAGEVGVSMMTLTRGSSNAKARRELGWEPRWSTWREGFRHGLRDPSGAEVG
ncbi:MAG: NAD-dependent epimerase/dehydratase family protein [Nocardioidaceae bacterium]